MDSLQTIEKFGLSTLNGDYEILSLDSNNLCKLDDVFFYSLLFREMHPSKNKYVSLEAIDDRHINATLFVDDKKVKAKTIKGRLVNKYFEFHTTRLKFRFIINVYAQQSGRLAVSKDGDLYLDNNQGGIAFLVILPIPLSGSSYDTYNLKFRKKNKSG